MKTYYIPTSTLNFNAILSSESISPKAFYTLREFGIKRWTPTVENNIDDVILLYENAKSFSRDDSEQEDHPMLVAITTEETFPLYGDGVFYADHTLYLDPWHTRFIFFSEEHKRTAVSMSDSILDVKLLPLYEKQMVVHCFPDEYPKVSLSERKELSYKDKSTEIDKDNQINKLKGLLYGYYIGSYLSMSANALDDLTAFRTVHNYLADCISNGENCPIPISYIEYYERRIANSNHKLLGTKDSEIVVQDGEILTLKAIKDKNIIPLFNLWLKQVFLKPQYGKSIIPSREGILHDVLQVTDTYPDRQIVEQTNKYLQSLQDYFDGLPNKMSFNDGLLSSLSLVLLAGESWEKLLQVMQRNSLYDYRLAFAIYGCICGFADLYRTFTDYLLNCNDKDYVSDVYQEFYGQLFGKRLDTKTAISTIPKENAKVQGKESYEQNTEIIPEKYSRIADFLGEKSPELKEMFGEKIRNIPNFSTPKEEYDYFKGLYGELCGKSRKKIVKKKEWEAAIDFLKPKKKTKSMPVPKKEAELPFVPFYNDPMAFEYIKGLIPTDIRQTISDDLKWFQDDYNEYRKDTKNGTYPRGLYRDRSRYALSNSSVIDNYRRYLLSNQENKKKDLQWKKEIYERINIEDIIARLKERYK